MMSSIRYTERSLIDSYGFIVPDSLENTKYMFLLSSRLSYLTSYFNRYRVVLGGFTRKYWILKSDISALSYCLSVPRKHSVHNGSSQFECMQEAATKRSVKKWEENVAKAFIQGDCQGQKPQSQNPWIQQPRSQKSQNHKPDTITSQYPTTAQHPSFGRSSRNFVVLLSIVPHILELRSINQNTTLGLY